MAINTFWMVCQNILPIPLIWSKSKFRSMSQLPGNGVAGHSPPLAPHYWRHPGRNILTGTAVWLMLAERQSENWGLCVQLHLQSLLDCFSPPSQKSTPQSDEGPPDATIETHKTNIKHKMCRWKACVATKTNKKAECTYLCSALLLLHGYNNGLWAGGHTLFWFLERRSIPNISTDEVHYVLDECMEPEWLAQIEVWLLVRLRRAVQTLTGWASPKPISRRVWRTVEKTLNTTQNLLNK